MIDSEIEYFPAIKVWVKETIDIAIERFGNESLRAHSREEQKKSDLKYFAAHAPPVPDWFKPYLKGPGGDEEVRDAEWPWRYAENLLRVDLNPEPGKRALEDEPMTGEGLGEASINAIYAAKPTWVEKWDLRKPDEARGRVIPAWAFTADVAMRKLDEYETREKHLGDE